MSENTKAVTVTKSNDPVSELYDYAAAISLNGNENLANGLRDIAGLIVKERESHRFAVMVIGSRAKDDLNFNHANVNAAFARGQLYAIGQSLLHIGESRAKQYLESNHIKGNVELGLEFIRQGLGDDFRTPEKLRADGYDDDYSHEKCKWDGTELLRHVKSYPPYYDSTYEEKVCPACNDGFVASI
ncbi:MAG: hypothetical protein JRN62_03700 [Nitrososphaerota archaeon]|jgi:hypothetical protein|nr:hypothetical protein [Nitrososphaerota archaeon]MDG6948706.1 hypothetical protein [Nitrososphaerota archaeon]